MAEEVACDGGNVVFEPTFINRGVHEFHPTITSRLIDGERSVSHSQLRMASSLKIVLRSAKAKRQKHPQPFFSTRQIMSRIHRPKNIVCWHLPIERSHQPADAFRSDGGMKVVFGYFR